MAKNQQRDRVGRMLADVLELPKDLVLDMPRITMVGSREMLIENHKGLISYDTEQIRISLARGYIEIVGDVLQIKYITQDELCINGSIQSFRFVS